jgi:hypothetical protein
MASFSMFCSCSKWGVSSQAADTSSSATSWTEATTLWRRLNFSSATKSSTLNRSFCCEETMSPDKLLLSTVSTTRSSKSTGAPLPGSTSTKHSITYHLVLWSTARSYASMVDSLPKSRPSTRCAPSTARWKFPTKVQLTHYLGSFCDLMWSDPENIEAWAPNNRGAGWIFGTRVVRDFNHINGL